MSRYAKKTDRRPYEERSFSVRAVHRERADLHKLAEVLIRLTLQETGGAEGGMMLFTSGTTSRPVRILCY